MAGNLNQLKDKICEDLQNKLKIESSKSKRAKFIRWHD